MANESNVQTKKLLKLQENINNHLRLKMCDDALSDFKEWFEWIYRNRDLEEMERLVEYILQKEYSGYIECIRITHLMSLGCKESVRKLFCKTLEHKSYFKNEINSLLNEKQYEIIFELFDYLIKKDKLQPFIEQYVNICIMLNRQDEALNYFENYFAKHPFDVWQRKHQLRLYLEKGDKNSAIKIINLVEERCNELMRKNKKKQTAYYKCFICLYELINEKTKIVEIKSKLKALKSIVLRFKIDGPEGIEEFSIYDGKSRETDSKLLNENLLFITSPLAQGVIKAINKNSNTVVIETRRGKEYESFDYMLLDYTVLKEGFVMKTIKIYKDPQPIYVMRSVCHCVSCSLKGKKRMENAIAQVKTVADEIIDIEVARCAHCGKIFVTEAILETYERRFAFMCFERNYSYYDGKHENDFDSKFKKESFLAAYGYSCKGDQTDTTRQRILVWILKSGAKTKSDIQEHLSWLISFRGKRCHKAIYLWRRDLAFINNYNSENEDVYENTFLLTSNKKLL